MRGRSLVAKFSATAVTDALAAGATVLAGVPSMFRTLLAEPAFAAPTLRKILTGGETLGATLAAELQRRAPAAGIHDLYGLTETGSCDFHLDPSARPEGFGTIGIPTPNVDYRITDEARRPASSDRTPYGMLGYLDAPELTAASFVDGYFRTGDLARLRGDGRVEIVGRIKEIVSRGGNKIAPLEIDHVLARHPEVAAALCAGVPDPRLGEAICAVVVLKAGASLTVEALRVRCRAPRTLQDPRRVPDPGWASARRDRQGGPPRGRRTRRP